MHSCYPYFNQENFAHSSIENLKAGVEKFRITWRQKNKVFEIKSFSITSTGKKIFFYSSSATGGTGTTSISSGDGAVAIYSGTVTQFYLNGVAAGTNQIGFKAGTGSAGALEFYTNATEKMRLHQSGALSLGNTTDRGAGNLNLSGVVITGGYTVATLPTGVVGMRAYVTNALAPTYGNTVVGGGAVTIPVFYNGTNWIVA